MLISAAGPSITRSSLRALPSAKNRVAVDPVEGEALVEEVAEVQRQPARHFGQAEQAEHAAGTGLDFQQAAVARGDRQAAVEPAKAEFGGAATANQPRTRPRLRRRPPARPVRTPASSAPKSPLSSLTAIRVLAVSPRPVQSPLRSSPAAAHASATARCACRSAVGRVRSSRAPRPAAPMRRSSMSNASGGIAVGSRSPARRLRPAGAGTAESRRLRRGAPPGRPRSAAERQCTRSKRPRDRRAPSAAAPAARRPAMHPRRGPRSRRRRPAPPAAGCSGNVPPSRCSWLRGHVDALQRHRPRAAGATAVRQARSTRARRACRRGRWQRARRPAAAARPGCCPARCAPRSGRCRCARAAPSARPARPGRRRCPAATAYRSWPPAPRPAGLRSGAGSVQRGADQVGTQLQPRRSRGAARRTSARRCRRSTASGPPGAA